MSNPFETLKAMKIMIQERDAEIAKLRNENKSFRFALELYADREGWISVDGSGDEDTFIYVSNGWSLAQEALEENSGGEK